MEAFITKSDHLVQHGRRFVEKKILLRLDEVRVSDGGITFTGHFSYLCDGIENYLDRYDSQYITWEKLEQLSKFMPQTKKSQPLKEVIDSYISELVLLQLKIEGKSNYNIPPSDWTKYVKEEKKEEKE